MAANNYFGFTHGATQYGTTASGGYNQYPVPASSAAANYNAPRPPSYDQQAYHAAAAASQGTYGATGNGNPTPSYDYGYGRPTQSYDKAYYQQTPGYSGGANAYDNSAGSKVPGYQAPTTYAQPRPGMPTAGKAAPYNSQGQYATQSGYSQPATAAVAAAPKPAVTTNTSATYSNYDAAVYNATTMYAAQQGKGQTAGGPAAAHPYKKPPMGGPGLGGGNGKVRYNKPSQAKPQQLHYCEVCKISCAGPQTYREHLEGQKHKKRQAGLKLSSIGGSASGGGRGSTMHCQLCDIACTGADAYAAHVRGSKHQKVVKLHQKLGKPIPQIDSVPTATPKPPKINFVTESSPSMTVDGAASASVAVQPVSAPPPPTITPAIVTPVKVELAAPTSAGIPMVTNAEDESSYAVPVDVKPVGQEYIEEIRENGKLTSFNCKLCDCKFNDPNAKEMHLKGRRHRLQYKKKVQPDLVVDLKPSPRRLKLAEAKNLRNRRISDEQIQRQQEFMGWPNRGGYQPDFMRHPSMPPFGPGAAPNERRPESSDDRHVVAKHAEIYPKEEELQVIQRIVSHTERALKFVSDAMAGGPEKKAEGGEGDSKAPGKPKEDGRDNQMFSFQKDADGIIRVLKGVMRVGLLAKGLLLQGDTLVQLVVLCAEKPTFGLLNRVATELPIQLAKVSADHSYSVTVSKSQGAVIVTDGQITVEVSLTSPLLREQNNHDNTAPETTLAAKQEAGGSSDSELLPREPCLAALAALRHAKWFQARATGVQSCVMVMRVFRDLCQRQPTWNPIPQWAMELLIEKVITSTEVPLSPGDCMRRILEAVSSGLLINGPGILDPCEKDPVDALAALTKQEREDITVSGQTYLRLIAFRKIFTVLGMDMLPNNKFVPRPGAMPRFQRKRRRSATDNGDTDTDGGAETTVKLVRTDGGEVTVAAAAATDSATNGQEATGMN